jgi:PTS system mannose-specific IIA component
MKKKTIGVVIVAHGRLGEELRNAAVAVCGPQRFFEAISIGPDDDLDNTAKLISSAVARVDRGRGVVIFTDMFGGTPCNLSLGVMAKKIARKKGELIWGANLPMVTNLLKIRSRMVLKVAVRAAETAGRQGSRKCERPSAGNRKKIVGPGVGR